MAKPPTREGYSDALTLDCERVLVTLLRGLGPWKKSVFLVGGLTPRYIVPANPPDVPAHAGTQDVDVVIDLQILADTNAYSTLEANLKKLNFERAENEKGQKLSWRWQTRTERNVLILLELLADAPDIAGGRVQPLPTEGKISALNIPHSSIVFDLYSEREIKAELLGENGIASETIKHANVVSFTCLKIFAFHDRYERKDAHDLLYCIENAPGGIGTVAELFHVASQGKHGAVVRNALETVKRHFITEPDTEGYLKDGPVAVAKFELGEADDPNIREARALRQRDAADVMERLMSAIESASTSTGKGRGLPSTAGPQPKVPQH